MSKSERGGAGGGSRGPLLVENRQDSQMEPEHLLPALLELQDGVVPAAVAQLGFPTPRQPAQAEVGRLHDAAA